MTIIIFHVFTSDISILARLNDLILYLLQIFYYPKNEQGKDGTEQIKETEQTDAGQQDVPLALPEDLVGQTGFEAHDMEGNAVSSEIFAQSKITMVNVWATYCNPCLNEMPALGELAQAYDAGDFQIIGIISSVFSLFVSAGASAK